jgi:hypothetical protein
MLRNKNDLCSLRIQLPFSLSLSVSLYFALSLYKPVIDSLKEARKLLFKLFPVLHSFPPCDARTQSPELMLIDQKKLG